MWFVFALLTALAWGGADLFYKKGSDSHDRFSHIKIVIMVGLVMGIHATAYMFIQRINFDPIDFIRYFPVSALYILSMTIGYIGLRYIELSIASPVQNSSGAVTAVLLFIFFTHDLSIIEILGVSIITLGVIGIAILEKRAEREALQNRSTQRDKKYQIGFMAITFPILYCFIDGLGTFADAIYLDELSLISEDAALLAYEFTFFICAVLAFTYLKFIKKQQFNMFKERVKGYAAIFETTGQFFYVFAMSSNAIIAAPLIASYSIFSVILSRIFLKERLNKKQYAIIVVVIVGIALLGIADEL
ncbi:EamA family transporter [Paenibacillus apiarius]|uniref:DMT family transporter n=1 Tax=Paenibacillus apiarius TaxID=46240 RepID=A0ABT4E1V3_9BACL|nr:EamA family transporter [Paenibacillus apiarius]MCY9517986.1 DMT family transporter [Paenibacillus apiarius]MCY9523475.1 DMT family transporter [Paenibacillus apiarius]MCY9555383.1 DMT family transporter [Paenibacillus apiarius]MCY9558223.1 DMT family transporter [Paenibacillus apiarius]MCY9684623.1 DMT family transporter [Paenibacillus apiarius]